MACSKTKVNAFSLNSARLLVPEWDEAAQNGAIRAFFDLSTRANMVNAIEANRASVVQDEHAMGSWLIVPATAALFGGWSQSPSTRLNELAHLRPEKPVQS